MYKGNSRGPVNMGTGLDTSKDSKLAKVIGGVRKDIQPFYCIYFINFIRCTYSIAILEKTCRVANIVGDFPPRQEEKKMR